MADAVDKSQFVLPLDQPIVALEVQVAFDRLTDREKLYAHHMSEASWAGGLVTLLQTSVESAPLFVLLHRLFAAQRPAAFHAAALAAGFEPDEVRALLVFACGVLGNAGNYKGFGDSKIVPDLTAERLEALLRVSDAWSYLEPIWSKYKARIFDLGPGATCLGYAPHGCNTYLSKNCTPEDQEAVTKWLKKEKLEGYNTRLFKTGTAENIDYEIRLASSELGELRKAVQDNVTFRLTRGDYAPLMAKVAASLQKAAQYAASPVQIDMLNAYADSFLTGSLDDHKIGSRHWIKDKGPAVESYIGFIETYRDPAGMRGEFESFVAIVNREMSEKFSVLVSKAELFLPLLPWPKEFEKDRFLRPDFTSLDVLTFAGSGIPAGINIPNYDDIRQSEGFKNVSLGNVIPASYQQTNTPFISPADSDLLQKYRIPAFELQVGLHELLGHGSGKLFRDDAPAGANFPADLADPLTGAPFATRYHAGDTYDSLFGPLGSSYEECRAEAVGLYLSLQPAILEIFGHAGAQAEDIVYVNWLSLVWNGATKALETWDAKRGWLQAHSQARYVIAQVLVEAGVARVEQPRPDELLVVVEREKIETVGKRALGEFLLKLQVYKSTANVAEAQRMYDAYSEVKEPWLSWRTIVLANKQPRKIFVQANTEICGNVVALKTYEESLEGMILSWVERFRNPGTLYKYLLDLSVQDEEHF